MKLLLILACLIWVVSLIIVIYSYVTAPILDEGCEETAEQWDDKHPDKID